MKLFMEWAGWAESLCLKEAEVRKAVVKALEARFSGDPGVTKALNGAGSATPK